MKFGEIGEICISGPTLMSGYYEKQIETQNALKIHLDGEIWMRTGDLAYINKDGCLFLSGRLKRIIVRHDGIKVLPFTIENILINSGFVDECCVVGQTDTERGNGQVPIAFIVMKEPDHLCELIDICSCELSENYRPKEYKIISKLPLTPNGKIDYRSLEKQAEEIM